MYGKKYTAEELEAILAEHATWWRSKVDGKQADLSGADLRWAKLSGANLRMADLSEADLSRANLSGANLCEADLRWANLSGADLSGADLREADLSGANLNEADLSGANLSRANLRGLTLRGVNLSGADLSETDLRWADLSGTDLILSGQNIEGYLFWAFPDENNVVIVRGGFDTFVGISAARKYWSEQHLEDTVLHEDCLSLVERCEHMAKVRGWKLNPDAE